MREIGTRLGDRYELIAEIGRGGMGVVFRARDPLLERDVAVKMIVPGEMTLKAEERFRREARIVAAMDHPAIVPVYDFGRHGNVFFFVMPLVSGRSLRRLIETGKLSMGAALEVGAQAAEALDHSHQRRVVHRDIKPENLMVTSETTDGRSGVGRVRLMDFGLARSVAASRSDVGWTLRGTVSYMSPEQIEDDSPLDGRSDLYSLGVVLYESLAGEPPFQGRNPLRVAYRVLHEPPRGLLERGLEISPELEDLVLRCLAKKSEGRPARGSQLATDLRRMADALHVDDHARPAGRIGPAPKTELMIGRDDEVRELDRHLEAACGGMARLVLLGGEEGVGKTRLLREMEAMCRARGVRVLHGRGEGRGALPFQGLCELIQDAFRLSLPTLSALDELASELLARFPALRGLEALRSAVRDEDSGAWMPVGGQLSGSGTADVEPSDLHELLARVFSRLADGEPLALLLEHLHDAATVDAVVYLVRRLGPLPLLIVATHRHGAVGESHPLRELLRAGDDPRVHHLHLAPLSRAGLDELLTHLLGGAPHADLSAAIHEAGDGNPFFTRELLGALRESGELRRAPDGLWTSSIALASRSREGDPGRGETLNLLPTTVQHAVSRRHEELSLDERQLVEVASVLGRGFSERDLASLAEAEGRLETTDLESLLERLLERGVLREEISGGSLQIRFPSGVARDALYRAQPRRRRRRLHRLYAEILERRASGQVEEVYPLLVEHYAAAEMPRETARYALAQAHISFAASSLDTAEQAARVGLRASEDPAVGEECRAELFGVLAKIRRRAGALEEGLTHFAQAVDLFEASDAPEAAAEAALAAAEIAWDLRQIEAAERWVARGERLAQHGEERVDLRLRLLTLGERFAFQRGASAAAMALRAERERLEIPGIAPSPSAMADGVLVAALTQPVRSIDPAELGTAEEFEAAACVFETLFTTDMDGAVAPCLAQTWRMREDGLSCEVDLRPGLCFSDGTPLDARAVATSFERAVRRSGKDPIPMLTALKGFEDVTAATAQNLEGIEVIAEDRLLFRLAEPLPIFPALLTNYKAAIVLARPDGALLGSGPFVVETATERVIRLRRNSKTWRPDAARLGGVELRLLEVASVPEAVRSGEVDLARDLLPEDLAAAMADPELRGGLVETAKKNVSFLLFNTSSALARHPGLRRAMLGAVRLEELVWRGLGRFAQPASSLVPPGIFAHDPKRRHRVQGAEAARRILEESGAPRPWRLRAAAHPLFFSRYRSLTEGLIAAWAEIGIEVKIEEAPMDVFRWQVSQSATDILLMRWICDYDDPDNFTDELFHSRRGFLRGYFSSPDTDRLLERARQTAEPVARRRLYRRFEDFLAKESVALPLFHDVDYRLAGRRVRGLELQSTPPYVRYSRISLVDAS